MGGTMISSSIKLSSNADLSSKADLAEYLQTGQRYFSEARYDRAIATYQTALALANSSPDHQIAIEAVADLHARLANAFMGSGNLDLASDHYKAALQLVPSLTGCWCNLASVYVKIGRAQDAIPLYLQALRLNPNHWPSRTNLVQALVTTKNHLMAKALLLELTDERPDDARLFQELGKVCHELNETDDALHHFEQAVALNPDDADSLYWTGAIRQALGLIETAQDAYRRAAQIQPLIRRPAATSPAEFRILALYAPFGGNTPTELLFKDACYDTNTLAIVAAGGVTPDLADLDADVVVNLISDADQSQDVLPLAADLVRRLDRPTVNDPIRIAKTTRDDTVALLQDIAACRVPRTVRLDAANRPAWTSAAQTSPFPLLARPAGTHGGDDFDNIADSTELAAFADKHAAEACYLIEYIDYRSADGFFRKYRFIFVGDEILPYHLAIGDHWKIHHDSTDMRDHVWMQQEELAFLTDPHAVFGAALYQALRTIKQRVGLDYFGIDCGIDPSGNLVVFEVNASMLVHDRNEAFPYKDPFVAGIKTAFDAMLRQFAARGRA